LVDAPEFLDPLRRPGRRKAGADGPDGPDGATRWTDPDRLILALDDTPVHTEHHMLRGQGTSLGIHGIFRALFGDEPAELEDPGEDDADTVGPDDEELETVTGPNPDTPPKRPAANPAPDPEPEVLPQVQARERRRFERYMDEVFDGLSGETFRQTCTPGRLQMAAAFPVVAVLRGLPRGFTDEEQAMALTRDVINLLVFGHEGAPPLLDAVTARYRERDELDHVTRALGDGLLWTTLAAALCLLPWQGPAAALHRAVLLSALWQRQELRAHASPERIRRPARRYRTGPALEVLRDVALPAAASLQALEAALPRHHQELWADPDPEREPIREGDVLWSPTAGWALALEAEQDVGGTAKVLTYWVREGRTAPFVVAPFWISVRQAVARDPALATADDALREVLQRIEQRTEDLVPGAANPSIP
jgi:hypothetical protein